MEDQRGEPEGPGAPGREEVGLGDRARGGSEAAAPEEEGLSTGAKIGLGCGGCLVVALAAVGIGLAMGGGWIAERAGDFVGGVEQQAEATETLNRLREEHPFEVPDDGAVSRERARRFFRATDAAWREMRDWPDELDELGRRLEEGEGGLSDLGGVLEGYGRLAESRVVIARALEEQEMPLEEYLWTGLALRRAHQAMEEGTGAADELPEATRRSVRAHREEISELADGDGPGKEAVFAFAWVWGTAERGLEETARLDTLLPRD